MPDLATLGLRVDGAGSILTVKQFGDASEKAGLQTDHLEASVKRLSPSLSSNANVTVASTRNMGAWAALQAEAAGHVGEHSLSIGRLERALASYVGQQTGANSITEIAGASLLKFGVGTVEATVILGGLALAVTAASVVYKELTADSRAFEKATDDLVASLLKEKQALFDATLEGKKAAEIGALNADIEAQAALRRLNEGGFGLGFTKGRRELEENAQRTSNALTQSEENTAKKRVEINTKATQDMMEWEKKRREDFINGQRIIAEEEKKAAEAEKQRLALIESRSRHDAEWAKQQEERDKRTLSNLKEITNELEKQDKAKRDTFEKANGIDPESLHLSIKLNVDEALKRDADANRSAREFHDIWARGIERIVTTGTKSFRNFFDDVLRLFEQLMVKMEQEGKTKGLGYKLLGYGSAAITGAFTGYNLGQQGGGAAGGSVLGAFGGAAAGYAIAGGVGAVVGGLTGLVGGLVGGGRAAFEYAQALKAATLSIKTAIADFHAVATGTQGSVAEQIRQVHAQAEALRLQATSSIQHGFWSGPQGQNAFNSAMAQINADEAAYIARLKEEQAIKNQQFAEDLRVRLLRAHGQTAEADRLAQQLAQQREYDQAVKAGADATTLAFLKTVQAAETLKAVSDALNTSVRNAPSGFKIESYINRFAAPAHWGIGQGPMATPYSPGYPSPYPKSGANASTVNLSMNGVTFTITGETGEKLFADFMNTLRKKASETVGGNVPLAETLDYV